jgi:hypothetical protein
MKSNLVRTTLFLALIILMSVSVLSRAAPNLDQILKEISTYNGGIESGPSGNCGTMSARTKSRPKPALIARPNSSHFCQPMRPLYPRWPLYDTSASLAATGPSPP